MMKRLFDVVAATAALVLLSPVLLILAVLVRFTWVRPFCFDKKDLGDLWLTGSLTNVLRVEIQQIPFTWIPI